MTVPCGNGVLQLPEGKEVAVAVAILVIVIIYDVLAWDARIGRT